MSRSAVLSILALAVSALMPQPQWMAQSAPTGERLRGVSAVDRRPVFRTARFSSGRIDLETEMRKGA
jgi:hypothetical protein